MGQKKFFKKVSGKIYPTSRDLSRRWWFYYWIELPDGTQQRTRHYIPNYPTTDERDAFVLQKIADFRRNGVPPPAPKNQPRAPKLSRVELRAILEQHNLTAPNRRASTNSSYKGHIEAFDAWLLRQHIQHVTPAIAEQYIYALRDKGLAGNTVNAHRTTLRKYYAELLRRGRVASNPFEHAPRCKKESQGAEYFRAPELATLKTYLAAHHPAAWLCCQFQYYCFIRPRAEFRQLRVADVDLEKWTLRVPAAVSKNNKHSHVIIPAPFRPALAHLANYPPQYYLCGPDGLPAATPIGENFTYNHHARALAACGISGHTLYSWKHTGVVHAYRAGIDMEKLRRQLRHHSLDMVIVYLRSLGLLDLDDLATTFPTL